MATKIKNLFPKLARGGYVVHLRFLDEARGERYFDAGWSVGRCGEAGSFTMWHAVNYRGDNIYSSPAAATVGKALRVGDQLAVEIEKHTVRGRSFVASKTIRVTSVILGETEVTVGYEII